MESRSSLPLLDCSNPLQASIARARAAQRAYYRRTHVQLALDEEEPMPENNIQEAANAAVEKPSAAPWVCDHWARFWFAHRHTGTRGHSPERAWAMARYWIKSAHLAREHSA